MELLTSAYIVKTHKVHFGSM